MLCLAGLHVLDKKLKQNKKNFGKIKKTLKPFFYIYASNLATITYKLLFQPSIWKKCG